MIIIGDVPVLPTRFGQSLYSKKGFAHYQKLTEIAHKHDCRICAQLHQTDTNIKGMIKYIPGVLSKKIYTAAAASAAQRAGVPLHHQHAR